MHVRLTWCFSSGTRKHTILQADIFLLQIQWPDPYPDHRAGPKVGCSWAERFTAFWLAELLSLQQMDWKEAFFFTVCAKNSKNNNWVNDIQALLSIQWEFNAVRNTKVYQDDANELAWLGFQGIVKKKTT